MFSLRFLFVAIGLALAAAFVFDELKPGPVDPAAMTEARAIAEKTVVALGPTPAWSRVEIARAEPYVYSFDLIYRAAPPGDEMGARADATRIVETCLKTLIAAGHRPATEGIAVMVAARQEGLAGATGEPLVRSFGIATYRYGDDRIEYRPAS